MADNQTGESNLKRFIKENKTLVISIPILVILIILVVIIYSSMGGEQVDKVLPALVENAPADMTGNQVEVLPQIERETGNEPASGSDKISGGTDGATDEAGLTASDGSVKNPFSGRVKLTGIVIDGNGSMAVLEIGGKTYIATEKAVLDNGVIVSSISFDKVMLRDNGKDIELSLE